MNTTIQISAETYDLLQRRARETHATPEQLADAAIRLQLGHASHIEQRQTATGLQAYLRGTRVAVWHIAAFLQGGYTAEDIIKTGLPHLPPAAIYEAKAYYYDHQPEIDSQLQANTPEAALSYLREKLSPEQFARLTGQAL